MSVTVSCPQCKRQLSVPEAALGQPIKCPPCGFVFSVRSPAPPPPPPAPAPGTVVAACTSCGQQLRVPADAVGRPARCPHCQNVFTVHDSAAPPARTPPAPPPPRRAAAPPRPKTPPPPKSGDDEEELDELEVLPGRGERPAAAPAPLRFPVVVRRDPERALKGKYAGEWTEEGLRLRQGKKKAVLVPVGTRAEYLGEGRFAVTLESRPVELEVVKFLADRHRLAEDVAAALAGQGGPLRARDYALPWYAYAPAAACVGISILALVLLLLGHNGFLAGVAFVLGLGLAAGCLFVVLRQEWTGVRRGLVSAGVAAGGYALVVSAFILAAWVSRPKHGGPAPGGPGSAEAALPADLDLVPRDALGFVSVRPADIWNGESGQSLQKMLKEDPFLGAFVEQMNKKVGLTLADVERVVGIVLPGTPEPKALAVVTTAKPFDRAELLKKILPGAREESAEGKPIFIKADEALHFLSDRAFIISDPPDLKAFLKRPPAKDTKGPLAEPLREAAGGHQVFAAVAPGALPAEIKKQLAAAKEAEPFRPLLDAKLVRLTLDLTKELRLEVRLEFDSEEAAQKGEQAAGAALMVAQGALPMLRQMTQPPPGKPDPALAKIGPVFQKIEAGLKEAKFTRDGRVVKGTLVVQSPDVLAALAVLATKMLVPVRPGGPPKGPGGGGTGAAEPITPHPRWPGSGRDKVLAWVKDNNAFGPTSELLDRVSRMIDGPSGKGGCVLSLGPGLVKSGTPTVVCDRAGYVSAFPMPGMKIGDKELGVAPLAESELRAGSPMITIGVPRIDGADRLAVDQKVTGSVGFREVRPGQKGNYAVRLYCQPGGKVELTLFANLGQYLVPDQKRLPFTFEPIARPGVTHDGDLILFLDVVDFVSPNQRGGYFVVSNTEAVKVKVVGKR